MRITKNAVEGTVEPFLTDLPPNASGLRTVGVCAGIGDNIWLIQKLRHAREKFAFCMTDDEPKRGKQIFDLAPDVTGHFEYGRFNAFKVLQNNIQDHIPRWQDIKQSSFYLSINHHLEIGKRIEEFLPDLPVSFRIDWKTSEFEKMLAAKSLSRPEPVIGLYGSSYSSVRSWGFWKAPEWTDLAVRVRTLIPEARFAVIGATFDTDLANDLVLSLQRLGIPVTPIVGMSLGTVVEVMKKLTYFFSFPSGLAMLATTIGTPTLMFYPKHLEAMIDAWAAPNDIADLTYKGMPFCEPEKAMAWVKNEYLLTTKVRAA